ncbi:hypothetical protein [Sphingomonas rubra]
MCGRAAGGIGPDDAILLDAQSLDRERLDAEVERARLARRV